MSNDSEYVDFNLLPEGSEVTVRRLESSQNSVGQINAELDRVGFLYLTLRCAVSMLAARSANFAPDRRTTGTAMLVSRPP